MPVELWPLMQHRMDHYRAERGKWGFTPDSDLEPRVLAAVAEIGRPSANRAPMAMPVVADPAASGAARPRIAPLPNCGSFRRESSLRSRP